MGVSGRRAVVTGAAQGLGRAIAERLAQAGAAVAIVDRNLPAAQAAADEISRRGATAMAVEADVSDRASVRAMADAVGAAYGGVDILVNNAGIVRDGWLTRLSEADWDAVLDTNLKSAFLCASAVVPFMAQAGCGRIVNISSRAWLGNPGQVNYASAKGGLVSLTRTLALELGRQGITVNCVAPGLIDTPLTQSLRPDVRERLLRAQPTGSAGTPADVAYAVAFFADDAAGFITGQVLHVCGGKSVKADW